MQAINKILLIALLFLTPLLARGENYPKPEGFVNDFAGIIDPQSKQEITNILTEFEKVSSNEITIATIPSLGENTIEDYAVELFKNWGIGKKAKDNGLLILIAPNDHQWRIEVGYGLEQYINDALAGRIARETMVPHFRNGNFGMGILNGTIEIVKAIASKSGIEFDPMAAGKIPAHLKFYKLEDRSKTNKATTVFKIIFALLLIIIFIKNPISAMFILSNVGFGGGSGSFRGGFGGGSGGFGGFGGGMSGGGGASGRW